MSASELPKLTDKEEELMRIFWLHGALSVRQALDFYPDPRPHFNTISTFVHILENKGYLGREKKGVSLSYYPAIDVEAYRRTKVKGVISNFFGNSYMSVVSALVKDESISVEELKELIAMVENEKSE